MQFLGREVIRRIGAAHAWRYMSQACSPSNKLVAPDGCDDRELVSWRSNTERFDVPILINYQVPGSTGNSGRGCADPGG